MRVTAVTLDVMQVFEGQIYCSHSLSNKLPHLKIHITLNSLLSLAKSIMIYVHIYIQRQAMALLSILFTLQVLMTSFYITLIV